jgi:hypothetical protein
MNASDHQASAYKKFLDFFNLTQRARMDGLDKSYFLEMTDSEKNKAFEFMKDGFESSQELIRGMYLCSKEKALKEFKAVLKTPIPIANSKRQEEALIACRALMAGYVCRDEPTEENINILVSFGRTENEDTRAQLYKWLPEAPTTLESIELLKSAIYTETEALPLATSIKKLMAVYGHEFDPENQSYKSVYRALAGNSPSAKKKAIENLEREFTPIYAA